MDGLLFVAERDGQRCEIVEEPGVGYYVFRYVGDGSQMTHDYLQDDLEMAKRCAEGEFSVPFDAWRPAREDERPAYMQ